MTEPFDSDSKWPQARSSPPPIPFVAPPTHSNPHYPASAEYGQPGQPYPPAPSVHVTMYGGGQPTKNPGLAALLAGLFGPLGMLYATVAGALVMMGVNLFIFVIGFVTAGLAWVLWLFSWVGGIIWAYLQADAHNKKLLPPPTLYYRQQ